MLGGGKAIRYTVGVGRAGKQWTGTSMITGKHLKPAWSPPAEVKRDKPILAERHSRRLVAQSDGRCGADVERRRIRHPRHQFAGLDRRLRLLRLHPHVQPDILDLYGRVDFGTPVVVTR